MVHGWLRADDGLWLSSLFLVDDVDILVDGGGGGGGGGWPDKRAMWLVVASTSYAWMDSHSILNTHMTHTYIVTITNYYHSYYDYDYQDYCDDHYCHCDAYMSRSSKCKVPIHTPEAQAIHTHDPYPFEEIEFIWDHLCNSFVQLVRSTCPDHRVAIHTRFLSHSIYIYITYAYHINIYT